MKTRRMVFAGLFAAVICAIAPISIPVGAIPISLATFAIYITALVLDTQLATVATLIYIAIGAVGVPVFAGWTGGFAKIAGVTGGYIVGYLPCVLIIGLVVKKLGNKKWAGITAMVVGTAVLYGLGTAWFMVATKNSLMASLAMCVVPFLIGDAIKIVVASIVAPQLRKAIETV